MQYFFTMNITVYYNCRQNKREGGYRILKQIKIKISPNGVIEAETFGIKGKNCLKYLQRIEAMANATTTDSRFTDEYYETEEQISSDVEQEVHN